MASLATPLVFPLGGGLFMKTYADVWAQDLIQLTFTEPMKNDEFLQSTEAYSISSLDGGGEVAVQAVQVDSIPNPVSVYLVVTAFTIGKMYQVNAQNLYAITGAVLTPESSKFIGRATKIDSIVGSRPQMYDMSVDATLRKVLNAIGRQDDLIGGSRKDRFF